jgi:hypothetical protein
MRLSAAAIYEELPVQIGDLDQMPDFAGAILANLSQCRLLLTICPLPNRERLGQMREKLGSKV